MDILDVADDLLNDFASLTPWLTHNICILMTLRDKTFKKFNKPNLLNLGINTGKESHHNYKSNNSTACDLWGDIKRIDIQFMQTCDT